MQVRVPKAFIEDHESRACLVNDDGSYCRIKDILVLETNTHYTIELTDAQAAELLHDASHYAESGVSVYGKDFLGLIASARATRKALLGAVK